MILLIIFLLIFIPFTICVRMIRKHIDVRTTYASDIEEEPIYFLGASLIPILNIIIAIRSYIRLREHQGKKSFIKRMVNRLFHIED